MTVVVGYVPTATGLSAVREAEREARARDTDVLIVNVIGALGYSTPTAADERDLDAILAHLRESGIECGLRQVTDPRAPAEVLLAVARETHAVLIVLGLHQRSWLATRVLGSTARSVVLEAPCPVLIVPDVDVPEPGSKLDQPPPPRPPSMP